MRDRSGQRGGEPMKSPLPGACVRVRDLARAFTLLEIMLALAIFAAVMIAIYSSWMSIVRGSTVGAEAAREAQRSRVAVRTLENSLVSLQMFQANMNYYYFLADTSGDFASLSFVARLP